jgi:crotonobetainyl-CoA:carnitine CoA-transferase CaiB-like acyl-CoA transferase
MDWQTGALPLAGMRVIDWSVYWAGPYLGMMLHDLGAEVIKVESSSNFDPMRAVIDVNRYAGKNERPMTAQERANTNQHFNEWNRGKLSFVVELTDPRGRDLLLKLAAKSDIFIENRRPGAKEKLGIAYDDLRAVRPEIVYLSLSGFGQTPPERDAMALGAPVELASGLFSLNGYLDDPTPAKTGFSYGDPVAATAALGALLLAVRKQRKTDDGAFIDLSMRDTLSFGAGTAFTDWSMNHAERSHRGNQHPVYAPQGVYRCHADDQWIAISVRSDEEWRALCEVIGREDWLTGTRLSKAGKRCSRHDELDAGIEAWTSQRGQREAEALLQEAGVPAGSALDFRQIWHDPQLNARGAWQEVEHPAFGVEVRSTSQWSRGPQAQPIDLPAPCFGQHNEHVLREILGLDDGEARELVAVGVVTDQIHVTGE